MGDWIRSRADGLIHERINQILFLIVVLPLTGLLVAYLHQLLMALTFPLGAAYGIWLVTPDVDLETFTYSETKWLGGAIWFRPIGYSLYLYYYPLALVLRHRGISHTPIFGALIIYAYTWWLPVLLSLIIGWHPTWLLHPDLHVGLFSGLACAHLFHILEDRLLSS
ncbi:MAG: hypothetical protein U9Q78_08615 [Chloroflexota bacterium]|nr:hypothetical protein [Chloroflexota bacterium]